MADGRLSLGGGTNDEGRPNYAFDRSLRQFDVFAARSIGTVTARVSSFARDTSVYNLADVFPTRPGTPRYVQHVPTTENGLSAAFITRPGTSEVSLVLDGRRIVGTSEQVGPTGALQARGPVRKHSAASACRRRCDEVARRRCSASAATRFATNVSRSSRSRLRHPHRALRRVSSALAMQARSRRVLRCVTISRPRSHCAFPAAADFVRPISTNWYGALTSAPS